MIIRTLSTVALLVGGAVAVEPTWDGSARSLVLRVRTPSEMVGFVQETTERFAQDDDDERKKAAAPLAPGVKAADVAAGPVLPDEAPQEDLTHFERRTLDRLVREKTQED